MGASTSLCHHASYACPLPRIFWVGPPPAAPRFCVLARRGLLFFTCFCHVVLLFFYLCRFTACLSWGVLSPTRGQSLGYVVGVPKFGVGCASPSPFLPFTKGTASYGWRVLGVYYLPSAMRPYARFTYLGLLVEGGACWAGAFSSARGDLAGWRVKLGGRG